MCLGFKYGACDQKRSTGPGGSGAGGILHRYSPQMALSPPFAPVYCYSGSFPSFPPWFGGGNLAAQAGSSREELLPLGKVMGVAICTRLTAELCRDNGNRALAAQVSCVAPSAGFCALCPYGTGPGAGSHLKKEGREPWCNCAFAASSAFADSAGVGVIVDQMRRRKRAEVTTDLGIPWCPPPCRPAGKSGVGLWRQHLREFQGIAVHFGGVCFGAGAEFCRGPWASPCRETFCPHGERCAPGSIALAGTGACSPPARKLWRKWTPCPK